jgi:hypothetical protein
MKATFASLSGLRRIFHVAVLAAVLLQGSTVRAAVVFEVTSPYHHILVRDEGGMRTLCFDDGTESRMSLQNPLEGHFEYTEYFQMPLVWNARLTNVLMIGLGERARSGRSSTIIRA